MPLFLVGTSPRSSAALSNLQRLCNTHLLGRSSLTIVELQQHPRAREVSILSIPGLVKKRPGLTGHLDGDLSDAGRAPLAAGG
ncbi:circadian clock KaiB family protein [Hymenobacter lucidus]|uniref:KaiB domain-containing protein n=1 Tax=Hymenobacter lucidus TaxID=2880930 RepID=A0ABS8AU78_9BACT|nr:hypothetical protein [Hymenobacter lucidus]